MREGTTHKIVDYLDGFQTEERGSRIPVGALATQLSNNEQYAGGLLQFFPHAEGYVKATNLSLGNNPNYAFNYVFNYTDHLGNVRVSYTKDPQTGNLKILDESHYYPFGLKHQEYQANGFTTNPIQGVIIAPVANNPFKYKYQGQELQDELGLNWYSYKYRNYDPTISRFFNVDPLTEKYVDWGPYVFSGNRVVDARELEGLEPQEVGKDTQTLVIVTNGRTAKTPKDVVSEGKTLIKNLPSPYNQGDDGLSLIGKKGYEINNAEVINYAGSDSGITAKDIAKTIIGFKENNPNGEVIMVGHSLGAKDNLKAANMIGDIRINLMINLEAAQKEGGMLGSVYSQEVKNVDNLINFDTFSSDKKGGGGIGAKHSTRISLPRGFDHTNMDNSLVVPIVETINSRNRFHPISTMNTYNYNNLKVKNNDDGGTSP